MMIDFPEGIELYDIVMTPPHMETLKIALLGPAQGVQAFEGLKQYDPIRFPEPEIVEIGMMHGPWGWNEELRVLVVFGGAPVPLFESSWISDEAIAFEVACGEKILREARGY